MVYFLRQNHGKVSYIKIGHSVNVVKRIKSHQTSSAVDLTLLGIRNGMKKEETDLHNMLSEFRLNGEWFKDCPEVLKALDVIDHAPYLKHRKHMDPLKKLESYFYSNRYIAHKYDELLQALDYDLDSFSPDATKYGHGFTVRKLKMREIPDRQYHGTPFDNEEWVIYSSDYNEREAKFCAENPALLLHDGGKFSLSEQKA